MHICLGIMRLIVRVSPQLPLSGHSAQNPGKQGILVAIMSGCERYESLLSAMVSLGAELTVARDALALTPKKDSKSYQSAQSRFKEAEQKWRHARKELEAHRREHGCVQP